MSECSTDSEDRAAIEGKLAGDAANSISAKEFSAHGQVESLNHRGHRGHGGQIKAITRN